MRGARILNTMVSLPVRIIPADAGSTYHLSFTVVVTRDHPRGCGEHPAGHYPTGRAGGSSPRMRGALGNGLLHCVQAGIIPADAGSTWSRSWRRRLLWDHPRGCGEHECVMIDNIVVCGSSPRMRGALDTKHQKLKGTGIIPADAGSTSSDDWKALPGWDHPRGCGEHAPVTPSGASLPGSSPRMRGALTPRPQRDILTGIIPADAGST